MNITDLLCLLGMVLIAMFNIYWYIDGIRSYKAGMDRMQAMKLLIERQKEKTKDIKDPEEKAKQEENAKDTEEHWHKTMKSLKCHALLALIVNILASGCWVWAICVFVSKMMGKA